MGTAEVIRTDDLASFLGADKNQVESVLDLLAQDDLLSREEMIECAYCRMVVLSSDYKDILAEEGEFRCTCCERRLSDATAQPILTYRRGEKWEVSKSSSESSEGTGLADQKFDDQAWYPCTRLAAIYGVEKEALRKRLDRYRENNFDGGWKSNEDRRPREPKFLYKAGNVKSIIEDLRASSKRPTK
jgi:hypothetical protein